MIKNVIFDFGNVLFDLDLPSIERNLQQLMGSEFEQARENWSETASSNCMKRAA